jgi:hypothetical protein
MRFYKLKKRVNKDIVSIINKIMINNEFFFNIILSLKTSRKNLFNFL